MKSSATRRQRLRYAFDNVMSRGTPALILALAILTVALIAVFALIIQVFSLGPDQTGPHSGVVGETFYTLLHALDPGTIANDGGTWRFLLVMLLVTFGGLLIFSALIGVISTGLDARFQDLRKGRSLVIEKDHTLILGWGKPVFTILSELDIACEGEKDPVAVVLSETDKVEMDDTLRERLDLKNLRVVTRTGSPIDLDDLALVRPELACSTIVLAPEDESEPDSHVIKSILALTQILGDRNPNRGIVAEISDPANLAPARLAGGERAVLLDRRETVAKLLVQAARQTGISIAVQELLDFDGHEIYIEESPELAGQTFGAALLALEDCAVIGLLDNEHRVEINPPSERVIAPGEKLIAIAEDDVVLERRTATAEVFDEAQIVDLVADPPVAERVLILGWNGGAPSVIEHFDAFLDEGSEIEVVLEPGVEILPGEESISRRCRAKIDFRRARTTDRSVLDSLNLEQTDHVMVLACSDELDAQRADARTLVTLLHLREIEQSLTSGYSIVTEMVDERSRQLAQVAHVDDVIVSENIISLLFAQISQNRHLADVFTQLFSPEGSEIYLKPANRYAVAGTKVTFATLVEAARRQGECAIGYRSATGAVENPADYGMTVNPPKSARFEIQPEDCLIVLAED
ncbi:MAG: potassium transporter TrkA [Thermoleophilia bacterium]|nr:potassium transporter TrkA [Thermoleophilia bacterium]